MISSGFRVRFGFGFRVEFGGLKCIYVAQRSPRVLASLPAGVVRESELRKVAPGGVPLPPFPSLPLPPFRPPSRSPSRFLLRAPFLRAFTPVATGSRSRKTQMRSSRMCVVSGAGECVSCQEQENVSGSSRMCVLTPPAPRMCTVAHATTNPNP